MGLPVLRLPLVVFDNIYQSLDVREIIFLSQCSRRAQDLVTSQEGPRTGRRVVIQFFMDYTAVQVIQKIKNQSSRLFTLRIYEVRDRESTDEKSVFNLNIDGTTWDVKTLRMGDWYCVPQEGCYEKDVLIIVKMLRSLFNCSISEILIFTTNVNFQKLFAETDALHRAGKIYVDEQRFAPKVMDFMFDHFLTNYLDFWGYSGPEYKYQKPLNSPIVELGHAKWVNLENVLEMNKSSKHVELYEAILISDEDINQLIKWWLISDNKTLETLIIARGQCTAVPQHPGVEVRMNRSVIMEGIETTPGKKKREEAAKNFSRSRVWENGLDIIRKDGVQATILLNHGMYRDEFIFAVWHHPNPNVDE